MEPTSKKKPIKKQITVTEEAHKALSEAKLYREKNFSQTIIRLCKAYKENKD